MIFPYIFLTLFSISSVQASYLGRHPDDEDSSNNLETIGLPCTIDSQCGSSGLLICSSKSRCRHKYVFPLTKTEGWGTIVLTILMALAVMSGIGGGGIIVPLLIVFYKLETKEAISISGCTILSGSICRYIITINHRHPHKDATCIEYGLSNVMLPMVLIGSLTGVIFNMLLPSVILQICLTLLLAFLTVQSFLKFK